MGVESYKHRFAKSVLTGWLREVAEQGDWVSLDPISWRVNRNAPHYGVWEEYPVALCKKNFVHGLNPVWDEEGYIGKDGVYRFHGDEYFSEKMPSRPPTYDEVISIGLLPVVIFDIAIQHKGAIIYGIEVVHRNDVSETKAQMLRRLKADRSLDVFKVDADWILSQVGRPKSLKMVRA